MDDDIDVRKTQSQTIKSMLAIPFPLSFPYFAISVFLTLFFFIVSINIGVGLTINFLDAFIVRDSINLETLVSRESELLGIQTKKPTHALSGSVSGKANGVGYYIPVKSLLVIFPFILLCFMLSLAMNMHRKKYLKKYIEFKTKDSN